MTDTLTLISDLEKALRADAALDEAERWWSIVLMIESSLSHDTRQPPQEKEMVRRLRSAVSDAIRQIREKWPSPSMSSALIASGALRASVEKRTTGVDGWPMRR